MAETDKQFTVEVVSPERLLSSDQAAMVTIPGAEGEFGVFAGHIPLVAALRAGVVKIYSDKGQTLTRRIFVAGGFAEVAGDRVALLVEDAIATDQLDAAAIQDEIRGLEYDRDHKTLNEVEAKRLEGRLSVARAKQRAIAH